MSKSEENFECSKCNNIVKEDNEFCPACGAIFIDDVFCKNHSVEEAEGVCIICCETFCKNCGNWEDEKFLCNEHRHYEIYQNMARIYGSSDFAEISYLEKCLQKDGLHPFIFTKKVSPLSLGGGDYSLFATKGDSYGHIINEIKLMVPCQEVLTAEKIIEDLEEEN